MNAAERFFEDLVAAATAEAERRIMERIGPLLAQGNDRTLYIDEAAECLGYSVPLLRRLCTEKKVPHRRAGVEGSRKPKLIFSSASLAEYKREQERLNYQT
jgi:hypothetical protein